MVETLNKIYSFRLIFKQINLKMYHRQGSRLFTMGVLGSSGVGKTSIISRFLHNTFTEEYTETAQEVYRAEMSTDHSIEFFNIIDTAGHTDFSSMNDLAIQTCDAFILVFSATDPLSFKHVGLLQEEIVALRGDVPIIIIRNKIDLVTEFSVIERTTIESIVNIDWNCKYMEVSAKENKNIIRLFEEMLTTSRGFPPELSIHKKQKRRKNSCLIS